MALVAGIGGIGFGVDSMPEDELRSHTSLVVTPAGNAEGEISTSGPMKSVGWVIHSAEAFEPDELDASRATVTLV